MKLSLNTSIHITRKKMYKKNTITRPSHLTYNREIRETTFLLIFIRISNLSSYILNFFKRIQDLINTLVSELVSLSFHQLVKMKILEPQFSF